MRICFVCLGNICRSPMAEFILKNKLLKLNLSKEIYVTSRATSYEEEGNDIYPKAKQQLIEMNIPIKKHLKDVFLYIININYKITINNFLMFSALLFLYLFV